MIGPDQGPRPDTDGFPAGAVLAAHRDIGFAPAPNVLVVLRAAAWVGGGAGAGARAGDARGAGSLLGATPGPGFGPGFGPGPGLADVPVTAASVLVRDVAGRVLLTDVAARGHDLPGGHLDPGETPEAAARREVEEETGLRLPDRPPLVLLAVTLLRVDAPRPAGYGYPYPRSAMYVFGTRLAGPGPAVRPLPGTECVGAAWVAGDRVGALTGFRVWLPVLALG